VFPKGQMEVTARDFRLSTPFSRIFDLQRRYPAWIYRHSRFRTTKLSHL